MRTNQSNPPSLAIWWLRHACPLSDNEALTGDLIERFREGQSRGWFWRQVLIAFAVGVLREIRRHWPHFCYAIVGTLVTLFFWDARVLKDVTAHWSDLPWPWSQLAFELGRTALLALAALSILAAGLLIERSFRWVSLLRTGVLNLAMITFAHYSIDLFPWLLRSVPGDPYHKDLRFLVVALVFWFSTFLVAAWLGCLLPRHSDEFEKRGSTRSLEA